MVPDRVLPARVNQHVSIVRVDPNLADSHFVLYVINSPKYKNHLLTLAQGGATREALTKETIEKFQIPFPPLPTQRKQHAADPDPGEDGTGDLPRVVRAFPLPGA